MKIGVFDSGVGGLTVLREIRRLCPEHSTVYLGDSARVPYGTKSSQTISRYALASARFLLSHEVDYIVIACNTATAFGLDALSNLSVPVLGVIGPGARFALRTTKSNRIGVLGTAGTVRSEAYPRVLKDLRSDVAVDQIACPLFVPVVDEGWERTDIAESIVRTYLSPWLDDPEASPDAIILGCTHYPLLKPTIQTVLGPDFLLVDSAIAVAEEVAAAIKGAATDSPPTHELYLTDVSDGFVQFAERFWGDDKHSPSIQLVDLELERQDEKVTQS